MNETLRYAIANALYRLGALLFTGRGLRQCDGLRDALSVLHEFHFAAGPMTVSMDDADRALRFAFAECDRLDRYRPAVYVLVGFALGAAVVAQAWLVGRTHP